MLADQEMRLLSILCRRRSDEAPLTVSDLVKRLGVSQSLVSQRLRRLQKAGFLERRSVPSPTGRVVHYRPKPVLLVQWISPAERVALQWTGFDEVDWAFPLVAQVPDQAARQTLLALLRRLQQQDALLLPRSLRGSGSRAHNHMGLSFIVYGSCARGTARPGSDLDLITVQDEEKGTVDVAPVVERTAADVSLSAPRPIQLKHVTAEDLVDLPSFIQDSIKKEGLVVYDGLRTKSGGATRGAWDFVYGDRLHA